MRALFQERSPVLFRMLSLPRGVARLLPPALTSAEGYAVLQWRPFHAGGALRSREMDGPVDTASTTPSVPLAPRRQRAGRIRSREALPRLARGVGKSLGSREGATTKDNICDAWSPLEDGVGSESCPRGGSVPQAIARLDRTIAELHEGLVWGLEAMAERLKALPLPAPSSTPGDEGTWQAGMVNVEPCATKASPAPARVGATVQALPALQAEAVAAADESPCTAPPAIARSAVLDKLPELVADMCTIEKLQELLEEHGFKSIDIVEGTFTTFKSECLLKFGAAARMDLPTGENGGADLKFAVGGIDGDNPPEFSLRELNTEAGAHHVRTLSRVGDESAFGRNKDTVVDHSVRHSIEIDGHKLSFDKATETWLEVAAHRLAQKLGFWKRGVADSFHLWPHKLLIYPTGGKFDEHRDAAHETGAVASAVARVKPGCPGDPPQGGTLRLRCTGSTSWEDAPGLDGTGLFAFPLETPHRVEPVTSGTVVTITFDLVCCNWSRAKDAEEGAEEEWAHELDGRPVEVTDADDVPESHWHRARALEHDWPTPAQVEAHKSIWYDFDRLVPRVEALVPKDTAGAMQLDGDFQSEISRAVDQRPILVLLSDARHVDLSRTSDAAAHGRVVEAADAVNPATHGQLWCGGSFVLRGRDRVLLEALRGLHQKDACLRYAVVPILVRCAQPYDDDLENFAVCETTAAMMVPTHAPDTVPTIYGPLGAQGLRIELERTEFIEYTGNEPQAFDEADIHLGLLAWNEGKGGGSEASG